jgi:hypothetical protein
MRHPPSTTGGVTPQPPGRAPHKAPSAVLAMLRMPGLCSAEVDLSAGLIAPA